MLEIRYAGLEILGRPRDMTSPMGLYVQPDGLQGWTGISSRRREALARAAVHGEHDTRVLLGSRVVTIDGIVLAQRDSDLEGLIDSLTGAGGDGERNALSVKLLGSVRTASARTLVAEATPAGYEHGLRRADFQLQVVCANPRKYGAESVIPEAGTATSIPVTHFGNFPAAPIAEIPSAPSAYSITSPAGTYTVSGAVAGGTHRVDLSTGRVTRNGVLMKGVGRGPLWAVPAGTTWVHTLSVPGRVRLSDTFI